MGDFQALLPIPVLGHLPGSRQLPMLQPCSPHCGTKRRHHMCSELRTTDGALQSVIQENRAHSPECQHTTLPAVLPAPAWDAWQVGRGLGPACTGLFGLEDHASPHRQP